MTRLPALDGTTEGRTYPTLWDINNQGQIVGGSYGPSPGEPVDRTPTLWQDGEPMALPADDMPGTGIAFTVNERGQVLVNRYDDPYLWSNGDVVDLPAPDWEAVDLNDRGQVLMQMTGVDVAVWEDGELTPIRPPGDDALAGVGRDISEAGHVVGEVWSGGDWNGPYIWHDGTFTRLGAAGDAYRVNQSGQVISFGTFWDSDGTATPLGFIATDLNDRGQVVGTQRVNGVERAVLWEDGQLTDLGTLGGENSRATEINERGQVVGSSDTADDSHHMFVWTSGQMIDLGEQTSAVSGPVDINDHGQIIGSISHIEDGARVGSAVLWEVHDDNSDNSDPGDP